MNRSVLRFLRDIVLLSVVSGILLVAGINGAVRFVGGGYPHPLSPLYFETKVEALLLWAKHKALHPLGDSHEAHDQLLKEAAEEFRVPVHFARAVAITESNLMPHRISAAGAMGVMQLMPFTARDMGVQDPFDSRQNIRGGVKYLGYLWRRYRGDKRRIAAAYNAGMGRIPKRGPLSLPGETRHYVKKVLRETNRLALLHKRRSTPTKRARLKAKQNSRKQNAKMVH